MPGEMAPLTDNDIIKLYNAGKRPSEICKMAGFSNTQLYRVLKRNGIETRGSKIPCPSWAIPAYEAGESVLSISSRAGVSRQVVNRWITDSGLTVRGQSEANAVMNARMTPEQRASRTAAAHAAVRGKPQPRAAKLARAATVERKAAAGELKPSRGERIVLDALARACIDAVSQKAVDVYNIDIAISDSIAVEVFGGSWHAVPSRREREIKRAEKLFDLGWALFFVWDTRFMPLTDSGADKLVAEVDAARRNPSPRGKYWVVRGDGEVTSSGCEKLDDLALVLPSQSKLD